MKKVILLVMLIHLSTTFYAQNVGIGTNTPNASAILDITCFNKGVLFPKVLLLDTLDNTTIPNAAPNLMVFNSNTALPGGKGLYYNKGTVYPKWEKVGDLKLPFTGTVAFSNPALEIHNTGASSSSTAIQAYSTNGVGIKGISTAGTGVFASSSTGIALDVSGKMRIEGSYQTAAQGKVLTSDANGNATWEGAIAFSSTGIQPGGSLEIPSGVEKKVAFYTQDYDYGNNYNPSNGAPYSTFTAPVKGIYHFDVKTIWDYDYSSGDSYLSLKTTYNGVTAVRAQDAIWIVNSFGQHNINKDLLLEAGTQVYVTIQQFSGSSLYFNYNSSYNYSYFTGRLVMKL